MKKEQKQEVWRLRDLMISNFETTVLKTKNDFLNNWFSIHGGIVAKTINFITGNPGAGKTTFSFLLSNIIEKEYVLYYSREMNKESLSLMLKKFKDYENKNVLVTDKSGISTIEEVFNVCEKHGISVIFIDSLQIILNEDYGEQKDESAFKLFYERAKRFLDAGPYNTIFIIGHVTKNNQYKGRTIIQHMVDTHIEIIYNKEKNTREISFVKNRFGGNMNKYEIDFENDFKTRKMENFKIVNKEGNVETKVNLTSNKNEEKTQTNNSYLKIDVIEKQIQEAIYYICKKVYMKAESHWYDEEHEMTKVFKQYMPDINLSTYEDSSKIEKFLKLLEDENFIIEKNKEDYNEIFRFIVAAVMTYLVTSYKKYKL